MRPSSRPTAFARPVTETPVRLLHDGQGAGPRNGAPAREKGVGGPFSLICWIHPEWTPRLPWLVLGTTGRGSGFAGGDFRLFGDGEGPGRETNWIVLARGQGFSGVAHARQVHGNRVLVHPGPADGLVIGADADGHATNVPGVFAAVTVADCVPVFLVDPVGRTVALLHAGWRGTMAGILEAGVSLLVEEFRARPQDLLIHLGPAICEACYEVGPEVHAALGLPEPPVPMPMDLRGVLSERAAGMGILTAHVTRSTFCTRCGASPFYAHRGGAFQRQVGFLGIRTSHP